VVIRARNEAPALERLLPILAGQSVEHEVVVVDSGSADGTPDVAARHGAEVRHIAPFTFGGALNLGMEGCEAPVAVALSAHAYPRDGGWLARLSAWFEDPRVACAFGETRGWDAAPLAGPVRQTASLARAHPEWGYSNGAGGFRTELWRERPFREDMPGAEDREWALWALEAHGAVCVLDPAIAVDHDHLRDGLRTTFERSRREARGYAMYLDLPGYGAREVAREWWTDQGWHRSPARARLDPRRMARLAGKWAGRR
jgi:glycosyltransferase involved in cell wall biosynthesis